MAAMLIVIGILTVVAFVHKASRPIGQLSLFDLAHVTWLYRRWERWRTPQHTSNVTNIRDYRPR
jgi:hypothetical protein